ncbi:MAG: AmmeMemoRadiSam system protein B [Candidatus Cloacimonetes bacterium]|nr:AmmeMemoRadiSam system protein B [Candidatus Cloacimonadota bacterium]
MIRKPIVAGTFYSEKAELLRKQLEIYLLNAPIEKEYGDILGLISPHAGYVCSGQCAAYGYNVLKQKNFKLAVIIAPSHQVGGFRFSVGNFEAYQTPLGNIEVDQEVVKAFLNKEYFEFIPAAHKHEHSLEVQLPFLQFINPSAKILPVIFGVQNSENSQILALELADYFKDKLAETVFIISSDLSHYHDSFKAQAMDSKLSKLVESGDIDGLSGGFSLREMEACGFGGILTFLRLAKLLDYDKIENLNYDHSGNVTHDYSQVVGYLSTVIYR